MRTLVRDREVVYFAKRLPPVAEVDSSGYETGTMLAQYDEPESFSVRVSPITEQGEIEIFGAKSQSMKKIVESVLNIGLVGIDYLDSAWIGIEPNESFSNANYVVAKSPMITPRQIVIFLESVIPNGNA